jgi:hypothetical protein
MLLREIYSVYSEDYIKPIKTICGQNADAFNVNAGG